MRELLEFFLTTKAIYVHCEKNQNIFIGKNKKSKTLIILPPSSHHCLYPGVYFSRPIFLDTHTNAYTMKHKQNAPCM